MKQLKKHGKKATQLALVLCNVLLMTAVILFAMNYSNRVQAKQEQMELDTFCSTVESMKQVSANYLDGERQYARNWAAYMESQDMTEDEALAFIRATNTQDDRSANIVDMDTYEARSSMIRTDGTDTVSVYREFVDGGYDLFVDIMQRMFEGQETVLGRYRIRETQYTVISVGTPVRLREADGSHRSYLLLRVIPVESMKKIWIFPLEYSQAEIGLITIHGDYVLPSSSMRSENFLEFIRSYNYADDYNGADVLLDILSENDSGMLEYKNAKGEECYWYYSRLDGSAELDIVGCIPKSRLYRQQSDWSIVLVVLIGLSLLVVLDGAYILSINRRLRKTAKLAEQASDAKTQFLSSMSHDIRTPLNAVLGMTQLAKTRVDDAAYVSDCLDKITISGNHLLTLVNDVLDISKVESGKTVLAMAPFSVQEMADGLESIIRSQADSHGLTFTVVRENLTAPYLVGDKLRLNQIYLNLLTNAVKYTEPGGSVRMEMCQRPAEEGRVELECVVTDTGIGMTPEFQRTMYDSFARASDSRIDKIQGTGLGLAIVKRMAELMGGTISCHSVPGEGTTFTVRIALEPADPARVPRPVEQPETGLSDLHGLRLLIAEDNDLNWEIIATMLEAQGIVCERAENGRLCVDRLEQTAPGTYDMVLMDVQMPVLGGRDAAREIRGSSRADLRNIPIAAMTADAFAEDVQACLDAGMNAHLAKPVDIEKVLETIRRLCRRHGSGAENR